MHNRIYQFPTKVNLNRPPEKNKTVPPRPISPGRSASARAAGSVLCFTYEKLPESSRVINSASLYSEHSDMSSEEITCSISSNFLTSSSGKRLRILSITVLSYPERIPI